MKLLSIIKDGAYSNSNLPKDSMPLIQILYFFVELWRDFNSFQRPRKTADSLLHCASERERVRNNSIIRVLADH